MKNMFKIGLITLFFSIMLHANDKAIDEKNVFKEIKEFQDGIIKYRDSDINLNRAYIVSLNYITKPNGTMDLKIKLDSNETTTDMLDFLKQLISSLNKKELIVDKVYIDFEKKIN